MEKGYKEISQVEAKKIMDNEECIILDVRTEEEYKESHIFDAILLPLNQIEKEIENVISNKDLKILVYCRSGARSKEASKIMAKKGYKNVLEFGGIITWPFDIVQ